jgi:ribosomal protein S12 methylthiotransferase accessory factor YcaO
MSRPKVYRLSFDFSSPKRMQDFWETFVSMNRGPDDEWDEEDGVGWDECHLVHKDTLHDRGKSIREHLVRSIDSSSGRPVVFEEVTHPDDNVQIRKS